MEISFHKTLIISIPMFLLFSINAEKSEESDADYFSAESVGVTKENEEGDRKIRWKKSYKHEITALDSSSSEIEEDKDGGNLYLSEKNDNYTKELVDYFHALPVKHTVGAFVENKIIELKQIKNDYKSNETESIEDSQYDNNEDNGSIEDDFNIGVYEAGSGENNKDKEEYTVENIPANYLEETWRSPGESEAEDENIGDPSITEDITDDANSKEEDSKEIEENEIGDMDTNEETESSVDDETTRKGIATTEDDTLTHMAVLDRKSMTNADGLNLIEKDRVKEYLGKHSISQYLLHPKETSHNPGEDVVAFLDNFNSGRNKAKALSDVNCHNFHLPSIKDTIWICDARYVDFGSTCYLRCIRDDMVPEHHVTEVCTPEGWFPNLNQTDDYPECIPAPCVNLQNETLDHGSWHCEPKRDPSQCENTHEGTVCHMSCEGNFSPAKGQETTVCTNSGWHPPAQTFECEICAKPEDPENGWWECEKVHHTLAHVCQLECKEGFIKKGKHMVECLEDTPPGGADAVIQRWIPEPENVFCQPNMKTGSGYLASDRVSEFSKPCPQPDPVQFGEWKVNSKRTSSTLVCQDGFKSEGEISCDCAGGSWCCGAKDASQGCVPACSNLPPAVEGGSWNCSSGSPYIRCKLGCQGDQTRVGMGWALCGLGGFWTMDNARCSNCGSHSHEIGGGQCKCNHGFAGDGKTCGEDTDMDGVPDEDLDCQEEKCNKDNCPEVPNSEQGDMDGDGLGDNCDNDADDDGVKNNECIVCDNCPLEDNKDQDDDDNDGIGNACDNCPNVVNDDQRDTDVDGKGDACDEDIDGDGIPNEDDECPQVPNDEEEPCEEICKLMSHIDPGDSNGNYLVDTCEEDIDDDKDGIPNSQDNCPDQANNNQNDLDLDGKGDICDDDIDNDGIDNLDDNCPLISNTDQNMLEDGEDCQYDEDGDGLANGEDLCPKNKLIKDKQIFMTSHPLSLCRNCVTSQNGQSPSRPLWRFRKEGTEVNLGKNTLDSLVLSKHSYSGVDYHGTLYVDDTKDDDWIGLIFSYQSIHSFYALISAKQCCAPGQTRTHDKGGWRLVRVRSATGAATSHLTAAIVATQSVKNQTTIIWSDPGRQGWSSRTSVRWLLEHRPGGGQIRVRLWQLGKQIVDTGVLEDPDGLMGGRLGLFSKSQANIIWSSITAECKESVLEY